MTVQTWLWIGTIGTAIGNSLSSFPCKNKSVDEEGDSICHFLVPLVAMTLYLLMAWGLGKSIWLQAGRSTSGAILTGPSLLHSCF